MRGVQRVGTPGHPRAIPSWLWAWTGLDGEPSGCWWGSTGEKPPARSGPPFLPSLCLAVTLASIRSLGHLVAWRGLGPAPDISWACQLDQSVSRAIRALCHLPPLTPAVLLEKSFSQPWNHPVSALCRQHSLFPIHRCHPQVLCWAGPTPMAHRKENI